jgi:pSer/pThr/pTyr-binding forkhead associated (FHA) protein
MTCTTCGRENPPHLTFCQECGQRLGPRVAPPTPPIGLGSDGGEPRVATQLGGVMQAPAPQPSSPPPLTKAPMRCRVCDTVNNAGLRYCTSCGSTLEQQQPAVAVPVPSPMAPMPVQQLSPHAATIAEPSKPPAAIAPMRVVEVGIGEKDAPRSCPRCRGTVDAGAQFCKFCGASLADPSESGRPSPNRPIPAAAPPPPPIVAVEAPRGSNGGSGGRPATSPMPAAPPPPPAPIAEPPLVARPVPSPSPIAASPGPPPVVPAPSPPPPPVAPVVSRESSLAPPTPYQPMPIPSAAVPERERAPVTPAAAPARTRGKLVVIAKSGADGPSYPIGDTLDIGRVEGHIIVGEDPYLSPRHVRIAYQNGKLVLRDLTSTNGVYLRLAPARDANARREGSGGSPAEVAVPLEDQDLILVGQQVLRFEVVKDAESGLGPAVEHGTLLFGSPASPRYARLSQRTVEGVTRDVYYVRKMETVLGRESGDVVFTEDPFLSRRHAAVRVSEGSPRKFSLVDLGSSNGSFLRIRTDVDLVPGDHFRVGQQLFRVDFEG